MLFLLSMHIMSVLKNSTHQNPHTKLWNSSVLVNECVNELYLVVFKQHYQQLSPNASCQLAHRSCRLHIVVVVFVNKCHITMRFFFAKSAKLTILCNAYEKFPAKHKSDRTDFYLKTCFIDVV